MRELVIAAFKKISYSTSLKHYKKVRLKKKKEVRMEEKKKRCCLKNKDKKNVERKKKIISAKHNYQREW